MTTLMKQLRAADKAPRRLVAAGAMSVTLAAMVLFAAAHCDASVAATSQPTSAKVTSRPALTIASAPAGTVDTPKPAKVPKRGKNNLLSTRNIFLSTRSKARPPRTGYSVPRTVPRDPLADWVLRGTLTRQGKYLALFENSSTGQTLIVTAGDKVGDLTITEITLDGVKYGDQADSQASIEVGQTLAASRSASAIALPATSGSKAASPREDNAGAQSILERMKRRRMQEMGGTPRGGK